jgi:hypothetical protein
MKGGSDAKADYWNLTTAAIKKGVDTEQVKELAKLHGDDYGTAIEVLKMALRPKVVSPAQYLAKSLTQLRDKVHPPGLPHMFGYPRIEPPFVQAARAAGKTVEAWPYEQWRVGGVAFHKDGRPVKC